MLGFMLVLLKVLMLMFLKNLIIMNYYT